MLDPSPCPSPARGEGTLTIASIHPRGRAALTVNRARLLLTDALGTPFGRALSCRPDRWSMPGIDETRTFVPLKIAVLTVSDTRSLAEDKSGATLAERIEKAGHTVADRGLVPD